MARHVLLSDVEQEPACDHHPRPHNVQKLIEKKAAKQAAA